VANTLLTIEDDPDIRLMLKMVLEDEGWIVSEAGTAAEGLERFAADQPDLVLVDLKLPDRSGFEVCRALRQTSGVPIIIVTAQESSFDVVAGLEAGADDYVSKPFEPKELAARIRALLRRSQGMAAGGATVTTAGSGVHVPTSRMQAQHFGDLEVAAAEGVVRKRGKELHLTKTEFRLFLHLVHNSNVVFSREELADSVWGADLLQDSRVVDAHVSRLRKAIEDDPGEPRHIVTVRGLGYKFVP
jgi:DNA-binding response OmpR family regulator